ncbi:hypothetical protein VNO78_34270 [Psophocarpus tetragonolobus]|uniref:Uncharacterized protein n=1 Tax=Psophocarpus tetragonolobus TaxID=3891 RepID=A0AAN9NVP5_PSOTE
MWKREDFNITTVGDSKRQLAMKKEPHLPVPITFSFSHLSLLHSLPPLSLSPFNNPSTLSLLHSPFSTFKDCTFPSEEAKMGFPVFNLITSKENKRESKGVSE